MRWESLSYCVCILADLSPCVIQCLKSVLVELVTYFFEFTSTIDLIKKVYERNKLRSLQSVSQTYKANSLDLAVTSLRTKVQSLDKNSKNSSSVSIFMCLFYALSKSFFFSIK